MRFLKIVVKITVALIVFPWLGHAQQNSLSIGTNQINNKAVLWLVPNASGQGLLLPVVSTTVRNGMGLQATDRGMIVFDSNDNSIYLWNGTAWNNLAGGSATTFTGANGITITGTTISTDAIRPTTAATGDLSGTFANPQIANNAVTTAKIANNAVDDSKIAGVSPGKIAQAAATNGQVLKWSGSAWAPADDLSTALTAGAGINITANVISNTGLLATSTAAGDVTGTFANLQIANGAITDIKLADNAVTTAKIANNAVITGKIADGAVTTNKLGDNSISTAKVQDANITTVKIADGAVTDTKVASGIAVNKLAPGTNGQVLTVSGGQASWQPAPAGSVPTLTDGQILIGNGTVNSPATLSGDATLAAGALTIANNAITTAKILDANVTNAKLANNSVDAGKIVDGSIANADLADNTITDIKIATGANIAATKLAGTVVLDTEAPATGDITGNFSTGLQIAANAVTTAEINNLAVTDAKIAGMSASKLAGTVAVANGGTGLATAPSNGQLLIGNGTGYTLAPLTSGAGINIVNAAGSVTISSTGLTNPMNLDGDLIYGGSGGVPTRLAAGIGFLRGGSPPTYSNVNLASLDVTGILPVTNGGTGLSTFGASAGLLYNSGPTTLGNISNGSAGQMLLMTGSTPSWQTMLGDATINGSGLLSIAANATAGGNIISAINANGAATINGARVNPTFGAQAISTTGTLTTGSSGQFTINATGNITRINNIATSFPAAQGAANSVLTNDGAGNLSWAPGSGWGLTGNTLTGTERIGSDNAQPLVFETDNTERMRITPTGNIGIGTPTPTGRLGISGGELQLENLGVGLRHFSGAVAVGSSVTATAGGLGTLSNHSLGLFANGLDRMTILPSGNVGIGTTTPASRLDVNGDVRLAQSTAPGIVTDKLYNVGGSLFWNGTNISSGSFSTNDVIPKGSASGLVASGITDNGTLVDITRPSSNGILTRIFNQQGGGSGLGTLLGTVGAQILASDDAQNQVFALQAAAGGTNPSAQMGGVSASASGAVNWNRGVIATAENASATNTGVDAFATGNTGDNYGIRSNVGGTQTNPKYGLYVAASGNGTKYGVYAQGENANYLSGRLGIGAPSPAVSLDVQGTDAINFPKGTAGERPATPSAGAMRFNSTENVMEYFNGTDWYFVTPKVAILSDVKPTGTAGGGPSTGGVWTTRTLNSISGDASFLSLTANQFTIGPGEYRVEAVAPAYQLSGTKLRIFNTTLAQTLVLGSNEYAGTGGPSSGVLVNCSGIFSLLSSATLVLSHYATTSNTTDGFGIAVSAPLTPEVYAVVKITKLR